MSEFGSVLSLQGVAIEEPTIRVFEQEGKYYGFASAEGFLVAKNYEPPKHLVYYKFDCELTPSEKTSSCNVANFRVSDGRMDGVYQETYRVKQWDEDQVIAVNELPTCRREVFVISPKTKSFRMESYYKPIDEQKGDCSLAGTDTRKGQIVSWGEGIKELRSPSSRR
jgi:hypothetical protein